MDISIIVPAYNGEQYIDRCLDSLVNQETKCSYEILLIDDGSRDKTFSIAKNWERGGKCIRVFSQNNQGPSSARNFGIQKASGNYIVFVDVDDTVSPYYIDNLFCNVEKKGRGIVVSGLIANNNKVYNFPLRHYSSDCFGVMLDEMDICLNGYSVGKLYNREMIIENNILFDTEIRYAEDLLFFLKNILVSDWIQFINKYDYYYRTNDATSLILSYNSFDSECAGYRKLLYLLDSISEKYNIPKVLIKKSYGWLGHFISRSIITIHKEGKYKVYSSKNRIDIIKVTFGKEKMDMIYNNRKMLELKEQIIIYLLFHKQYVILEYFVTLYFRIRDNLFFSLLLNRFRS